jgi:hypothetical protein
LEKLNMARRRLGEDGKPDRKGMLDSMHEPNSNPNATSGNIPGVDTIVITSSERLVGGDFSAIGGRPRTDLSKCSLRSRA